MSTRFGFDLAISCAAWVNSSVLCAITRVLLAFGWVEGVGMRLIRCEKITCMYACRVVGRIISKVVEVWKK